MPLTNSLKPLLDIPTWEWSRFAPAIWDGLRPLVGQPDGLGRYLYTLNSNVCVRYDMHTDAWQTMATAPLTLAGTVAATYSETMGYAFRPISAGSTTVTGALLSGDRLKGATIRVISGTGVGQVRTITSVADQVMVDRGYATSVNQSLSAASYIRDTNKNWTINQWVGYQLRLVLNSGAAVMRRIMYNDANTLYFYDPTYQAYSQWEWGAYITQTLSATAGSATTYAIESSVATINSAWTVQPDSTSIIMAQTGGVFFVGGVASAPFFNLMYYDVIADAWSLMTTNPNVVTSQLPESILEITESHSGAYATGTASASSTTTSLADDGTPGWATNRWANYVVRITGGTGIGQSRVVVSNTSGALVPLRAFTTAPDATSTYEIIADNDKLWLSTNGLARTSQFSIKAHQWASSRVYDYGVIRALSARRGPVSDDTPGALVVTTISRTGTTATATTSLNHNMKTGDTVTISGATGGDASLFNGTFAITVTGLTTFTYTMSGTPSGATAVAAGYSGSVIVDVEKNWATNELVGKTIQYQTSISSAGQTVVGGLSVITANTSNTITLATAGTNNPYQPYVITDGPAFGFDNFTGNATTNGTGLATSGTTTTLVDTTKTWGTNEHANKILFVQAGTGAVQFLTVTSNTANTLTFGTATAPALNSRYSIMPLNARGAGLGFRWASYPDDIQQGRYIFSFRGGTTFQIERYDITTQQWAPVSAQLAETMALGSMYAYDGKNKIYFHVNTTNKIAVFDVDSHKVDLYGTAPYGQSTAASGDRMVIASTSDGLKFLYLTRHSGTEMWRTLLFL